MGLRYARRVHLGAYTWRGGGANLVKMGLKWAKNTSLCTPNGPRSLLDKRGFHSFLTFFFSQNGPLSRHLRIFHGPKHATRRSK